MKSQTKSLNKLQTLHELKKEVKEWIGKNPNKTLKDYLKKFCKKKKNELDNYSSQRIDQLFTFMISEDMSNSEFQKWIQSWLDIQIVIDIAEKWDISSKRQCIREYYIGGKYPKSKVYL